MSDQSCERQMPEGMQSSRHVGWLDIERLPWLDPKEHDGTIGLAELVFDTGTVYVASAGTPAMNEVSTKTRQNTEQGRIWGKTDELYMRAARLVAGGTDTKQNGLITSMGGASLLFDGFAVECMHESPRPNTRRVYYARTSFGRIEPHITAPSCYPSEAASVMIRLAITDKQHQLRLLSLITERTRAHNKGGGRAGSI